jgi:hypothetical protein
MFDWREETGELRRHSTEWLRAERDRVVREQRRLHMRELAVTRVLDERDAIGPMPDASMSARTARATVEVARALDSLPAVAAAASAGEMSWDQLQPVAELATPETDRVWAERGARLAPVDLQRMARQVQRVTAADVEARHEARAVRTWRDARQGMGGGRWWLPDVDGVLVDKVLEHMAERMRPKPGERWDSLAHRKADALVELARTYADLQPTGRFRIEIVNILTGSAVGSGPEIEGIPLAPEAVDALRPQAKLRECRVDESGRTRTINKPRPALPRDIEQHVRRRDRHCRVPGCEETRRIQIHHLNPRAQHGDTDDPNELAGVCPHHHHLLEPHGPYRLIGNADDPIGLRLVHRDDLVISARAGPAP